MTDEQLATLLKEIRAGNQLSRELQVQVAELKRRISQQDEKIELLHNYLADALQPFMDHQTQKIDLDALPEEIRDILKNLPSSISPGE